MQTVRVQRRIWLILKSMRSKKSSAVVVFLCNPVRNGSWELSKPEPCPWQQLYTLPLHLSWSVLISSLYLVPQQELSDPMPHPFMFLWPWGWIFHLLRSWKSFLIAPFSHSFVISIFFITTYIFDPLLWHLYSALQNSYFSPRVIGKPWDQNPWFYRSFQQSLPENPPTWLIFLPRHSNTQVTWVTGWPVY